VEGEEAAADFISNLEKPKELFEIYIVRDLTTGTAFDMEELHNQYELFTLDAATSDDRKQGPDEGKRMIPELEMFSRVTEYPETQASDVGQQSVENLSHDYNGNPSSPYDKSQITWLHPRSLLSVSSDGTSIQVKALQTAINEEEVTLTLTLIPNPHP
jgi:hypothetical protein